MDFYSHIFTNAPLDQNTINYIRTVSFGKNTGTVCFVELLLFAFHSYYGGRKLLSRKDLSFGND